MKTKIPLKKKKRLISSNEIIDINYKKFTDIGIDVIISLREKLTDLSLSFFRNPSLDIYSKFGNCLIDTGNWLKKQGKQNER
jgi:hypothetical protein